MVIDLLEDLLETIVTECREHCIVRGSLLFRKRIDPTRTTKDLDIFVNAQYFDANYLFKHCNLVAFVCKLMQKKFKIISVSDEDFFERNKYVEVILETNETKEPKVPKIQLDIGRDADNLETTYEPFLYKCENGNCIEITVSSVYVDLAWKIQLLVNKNWRVKDLIDANQLYNHTTSCGRTFDGDLFLKVLKQTLKYRNTPIEKLGLIINQKFGKSRAAKQKWRKWQSLHKEYQNTTLAELFEVLYEWAIPQLINFQRD